MKTVAEKADPPPQHVLAAFGLSAHQPVLLAGGQGQSWRAGPAVLKPLDQHVDAVAWQAETLAAIDHHHAFRVSLPLPTLDGRWVADGWTAWRFEPGHHAPGRWGEIIDVGNRYNAALAGTARPDWAHQRTDQWAIGDRVAWNELPAATYTGVPHLARLAAARRPIHATAQLIHGDLTGNVLFDDALPPLIIDLSPYWRPPQFAAAIVVIDALVFHAAPATVINTLGDDPTGCSTCCEH